MKKISSKKTKFIWCSLGAVSLLIPTIAVSAVACSSEKKISKIVIKNQPENLSVNAGQTTALPTFSVSVDSVADTTFSYQWFSNITKSFDKATKIMGATKPSYTVTSNEAKTAGTLYFFVEITETQSGNILSTLKSNIASLTIKPKTSISISLQPQNQIAIINQTIKLPTFSVTVNNIEGADLKYQWYSNSTGSLVNWNIVSGATKAFYTVPADQITTVKVENYRVIISGSLNGVLLEPITSNIASLLVNEKPVMKISEEPTAKTVTSGETENLPTFSVVVKPIPDTVFTYQWYSATSADENTGGTIIANATKPSYTVPSTDASSATTKYFYVVIGGTINGVQLDPITSSVTTLTVTVKS